LRGLYAAVRDQYWNTVLPNVTNIRTRQADGGFELTFDAACEKGDVDFLWKGTISGQKDGTLRFAMDGVAQSTFLRNRIGFCVLHPLQECVGKPVTIETSGGKQETRFPEDISPHQPFKDLRSMTHEIAPGVQAEVRFEVTSSRPKIIATGQTRISKRTAHPSSDLIQFASRRGRRSRRP
jgi:small nuclear ribonucleoprotein (snRNP)-like protein